MTTDQDTTNDQEIFWDENESIRFSTGTKAEFMRTGKFKPEWFPGVKGNHKISMTIKSDELLSSGFDPTIVMLQIDRSAKGQSLFDIGLIFSDEERERRSLIKAKELDESAYKEATDLAKRWIYGLPGSVEEFKKYGARLINDMMTIHFNEGSCSKRGGYSFDKKTVREFDLAVDALCNILLNGKVNFYQIGHEQRRRELATEAFNRGLSLSLTGHKRDYLVRRFMNELDESIAETATA